MRGGAGGWGRGQGRGGGRGRARGTRGAVFRGGEARARALTCAALARHVPGGTQEGKWEGGGKRRERERERGKRREGVGEEGTFYHVTGAARPGVSVWRRLR